MLGLSLICWMFESKTINNDKPGLGHFVAGPFLFSLLFGGHPITIDGLFDDWEDVAVAYTDSEGDAVTADFAEIKITYDMEFLFIYFNFYEGEFLMQDWNEFHLYVDADNDPSTGQDVHGIGAELDWVFGERWGYQYVNGQQVELWQNDLTLRIGPTITSTEFEIAISRESGPLTMNSSQVLTEGKIILSEGQNNSDFIPDESGGVYFSIGEDAVPYPDPIPLARLHDDDIRIVSYNTWNDGIINEERQLYFKRILQALDPDVIALQEHWDWNEIDDVIQSWFPEDEWHASWTYRDLVVLSRFPILEDANMISSERTMAALLNTENELGTNLLLFNSHLSCCSSNEDRQQQVDEFSSIWRDWVTEGAGPFDLEYGTPFVHVGDFNYVGYRQQVETIRTGDIEDENEYGEDFLPDWDSTAIVDLFSRQTHKRMGYTWRSDGSSFNPGKLDYIFYSDATMDTGNHYTLNTLAMDTETLNEYGLQWNDTQEASDHLPRVFDISLDDAVGINETQLFPEQVKLFPNYPNPFNPNTHITFYLPYSALVTVSMVNVMGNTVKNLLHESKPKGNWSVTWDGRNDYGEFVSAGIYFCLLRVNGVKKTKKMVLLK